MANHQDSGKAFKVVLLGDRNVGKVGIPIFCTHWPGSVLSLLTADCVPDDPRKVVPIRRIYRRVLAKS